MSNIEWEREILAEVGLDIIHRETWEAVQSYTSERDVDFPVKGFVLHISVTIDHGDLTGNEHADMRTIERIGQDRFGVGFPYNAAAFDTGRLYEGQPLTRRGAHTVNTRELPQYPKSMNYAWRALVLPQMERDDVTNKQIDAAARWAAAQILCGMAVQGARWIGHRDVAYKACPGQTGYDRLPDLNDLTVYYVRHGLNPIPEITGETDMMILERNDTTGAAPWLIGGGPPRKLTGAERTAYRTLKDQGTGWELVPKAAVTHAQLQLIVASELKRYDMELSEVD